MAKPFYFEQMEKPSSTRKVQQNCNDRAQGRCGRTSGSDHQDAPSAEVRLNRGAPAAVRPSGGSGWRSYWVAGVHHVDIPDEYILGREPAAKRQAQVHSISSSTKLQVRRSRLPDVWLRLGVKAKVDVFGDNNIDFDICWQGRRGTAFSQSWGQHGVLWVHPPQEEIMKSLQLIQFFKAKAVVIIMAVAEEQAWSSLLWGMCVKYYFYKAEFKLFEGHHQPADGTWAVLVDGANKMSGEQDDSEEYMMVAELEVKDTKSSRRSDRRWMLDQAIQRKKYKDRKEAGGW